MLSAPGPVFDGIEAVGSSFHVLRFRRHFRQYRGRRVQFSCFALPDLFSSVPRASYLVFMFCDFFGCTEGVRSSFMFCALGSVFGGTEGVESSFHVLRSRTHFRWYRGRRVQFSCFALPYPLSAEPRASGPVFMSCPPGPVFYGTEGVESNFHILRYRTRFQRRRPVQFSYFKLLDTFSTVPMAPGLVFLFFGLKLVFDSTEGARSCFNV
jgi:hypothetical protein